MSFDLFTILPAVHRTRDIELAQSQTLLTSQEMLELNALKANVLPLSIDEQLRLDELSAKSIPELLQRRYQKFRRMGQLAGALTV